MRDLSDRARKFIVLVGAFLLATWLFPPWRHGNRVSFQFVFSDASGKLDVYRLVLLDLLILGAVTMLVLWPRKPGSPLPLESALRASWAYVRSFRTADIFVVVLLGCTVLAVLLQVVLF